MEYDILSFVSTEATVTKAELVKLVRQAILDGWQPIGGATFQCYGTAQLIFHATQTIVRLPEQPHFMQRPSNRKEH